MLGKCTEVILKTRRAQRQAQGQSGAEAIEEFRTFMGEVMGQDTEE